MRKQRVEYNSPVDALVAISKQLSVYENRYGMDSEDFYNQFRKGQMEDTADFVEWANSYQHYMAVKFTLEESLQNVAVVEALTKEAVVIYLRRHASQSKSAGSSRARPIRSDRPEPVEGLPKSYSFIGIGHSGQGNISTQVEATLKNAANRQGDW